MIDINVEITIVFQQYVCQVQMIEMKVNIHWKSIVPFHIAIVSQVSKLKHASIDSLVHFLEVRTFALISLPAPLEECCIQIGKESLRSGYSHPFVFLRQRQPLAPASVLGDCHQGWGPRWAGPLGLTKD
jgi:hypothetical protein